MGANGRQNRRWRGPWPAATVESIRCRHCRRAGQHARGRAGHNGVKRPRPHLCYKPTPNRCSKSQANRMALTPEEIERYKRHLVLREVGGQGQQKIKAAKVLVVGAGGLGSPLLMYLAAAGVGTIGIVDDDRVSLDNLQRQIVHDTPARRRRQGRERQGHDRQAQPARARRDPRHAASTPATRSRSSAATISSPTARTISPPAIW